MGFPAKDNGYYAVNRSGAKFVNVSRRDVSAFRIGTLDETVRSTQTNPTDGPDANDSGTQRTVIDELAWSIDQVPLSVQSLIGARARSEDYVRQQLINIVCSCRRLSALEEALTRLKNHPRIQPLLDKQECEPLIADFR